MLENWEKQLFNFNNHTKKIIYKKKKIDFSGINEVEVFFVAPNESEYGSITFRIGYLSLNTLANELIFTNQNFLRQTYTTDTNHLFTIELFAIITDKNSFNTFFIPFKNSSSVCTHLSNDIEAFVLNCLEKKQTINLPLKRKAKNNPKQDNYLQETPHYAKKTRNDLLQIMLDGLFILQVAYIQQFSNSLEFLFQMFDKSKTLDFLTQLKNFNLLKNGINDATTLFHHSCYIHYMLLCKKKNDSIPSVIELVNHLNDKIRVSSIASVDTITKEKKNDLLKIIFYLLSLTLKKSSDIIVKIQLLLMHFATLLLNEGDNNKNIAIAELKRSLWACRAKIIVQGFTDYEENSWEQLFNKKLINAGAPIHILQEKIADKTGIKDYFIKKYMAYYFSDQEKSINNNQTLQETIVIQSGNNNAFYQDTVSAQNTPAFPVNVNTQMAGLSWSNGYAASFPLFNSAPTQINNRQSYGNTTTMAPSTMSTQDHSFSANIFSSRFSPTLFAHHNGQFNTASPNNNISNIDPPVEYSDSLDASSSSSSFDNVTEEEYRWLLEGENTKNWFII